MTATTTGPYSSSPYYLRVTKNGNPDSGDKMQVSDGGPLIDERTWSTRASSTWCGSA